MYGARFKVGTMENYSYQRYEKKLQNISPFSPAIPPFSPCLRCLRGSGDGRGCFLEEVPTCAGALPGPHTFWHQAQLFWKLVGFVGKTPGNGTVSLLSDQH